MTLAAGIVLVLLFAFVLLAAHHFGHLTRVWHGVAGHPEEARWEGDYTAGCTVGPRACGALWDGEDVR